MASREFLMGAKIALTDAFSGPLKFIVNGMNQATAGANNYRDANGRLRNEMGHFVADAQRQQQELKGLGAAATAARERVLTLGDALKAVVLGAAAKKGFDWLVSGNAEMEQYQNTLSVVLKDQQKAADTLAWAQKFAADTPFEIPQVVEATTKLSAYGLEAQKVLGITGDMAAVMGKGLDQAVEAIADAQTGEVERLKEFGITKTMIEEQAKKMGATVTNSQGSITDMKGFNAALFAIMEERYQNGMALQAKTFKGMISNASDFIGTMGRQLGAPLFDKLKTGLGDALAWVQRLKDSGQLQQWVTQVQQAGGTAWRVMSQAAGIIKSVFLESYRVARQNIDMIAGKLRAWYAEHKTQLQQIGAAFMEAFKMLQDAWAQYAVPTIDWLRNVGLPAVIDVLAKLGGWIVDIAAWLAQNWGWIKPFVIGLAAAWGTYWAVLKAGQGIMLLIRGATIAWTAAQWALNVALNMNPIGLVITAIGLLVGAVILIVQHWDTIKTKTVEVWGTLKEWITATPDWLLAIAAPILLLIKHWGEFKEIAGLVWDAVKASFDKISTKVTELIENVKGKWQEVKDFLSNPIESTINLVKTGSTSPAGEAAKPKHATGLQNVPFDGYQAELHRNERVLTAAENQRYNAALGAQQPTAAPAQPVYNIDKLVEKVEIHAAPGEDAEALYSKFIDVFHRRVKESAGILSNANMGALLNG